LYAPEDFAPRADTLEAPEFEIPASELSATIDAVVHRQPRISDVAKDPSTMRQEYVQRSLIFRFPDVITFQTIPLGEKRSTLAVHSYSVYGAGDLGVNKDRIAKWLHEIEEQAKR
jgi:uncharacterized protein (DUF1499 family)